MSVTIDKDEAGIATVVMDMPDRKANILNAELLAPFAQAIETLADQGDFTGIVLTSAKPDFIAGADLDVLFAAEDPHDIMELAEHFKRMLRCMETLGKPVVAALNGSALGGGFEVALACHHRIAVDEAGIFFGLPEVTLGLLPGGGGTQRLPRLIGIEAALPLLLEGRRLSPREALDAGIIDETVAQRSELLPAAKAWISRHSECRQPWDRPGFHWPGGDPVTPKIAQIWAVAPAMLRKKTQGNYPAARYILAATFEGSLLNLEAGSRVESRYFAAAATSQVAKNMIRAFWFQLNQINKGENRPKNVPAAPRTKVGILGAGMMGAGIAFEVARHGLPVVLKDVSMDLADRGKQHAAHLLQRVTKKGKMQQSDAAGILDRITPTTQASDLAECDLIIEAVFEDRDLKARVTHEAEACMAPTGIFASNTSTLPITGLAEASARPDRFIGLHFFSPVEKMKLVEIIVGRETSDTTLAESFDFVRRLGKTPIVVNDSRGFFTSRVFSTYVLEGAALLQDGQEPQRIEAAGLAAGMPVGPLALSDEISLSLMVHIDDQTRRDLEAEGITPAVHPGQVVVRRMVSEFKRPGRKDGGGFYEYPTDRKKHLWPELQTHFVQNHAALSHEELMQRMMFAQVLEALRCLEEGVVRSVADANIGSIFGWGFAPFMGGVLQFINAFGLSEFFEESQRLAKVYGSRFSPPQLLKRMSERGETFV